MLNKELLEQELTQLPLYTYAFVDPRNLEFSDRVRWICEHECPMYGKSWACPPGVGSVAGQVPCLPGVPDDRHHHRGDGHLRH